MLPQVIEVKDSGIYGDGLLLLKPPPDQDARWSTEHGRFTQKYYPVPARSRLPEAVQGKARTAVGVSYEPMMSYAPAGFGSARLQTEGSAVRAMLFVPGIGLVKSVVVIKPEKPGKPEVRLNCQLQEWGP
ncbi:MAG: hypothetical protein HY748_00765 [Elusimicrobia bacterium]|nr:hypothetical protein [Elusimicrobiota bacterium]